MSAKPTSSSSPPAGSAPPPYVESPTLPKGLRPAPPATHPFFLAYIGVNALVCALHSSTVIICALKPEERRDSSLMIGAAFGAVLHGWMASTLWLQRRNAMRNKRRSSQEGGESGRALEDQGEEEKLLGGEEKVDHKP